MENTDVVVLVAFAKEVVFVVKVRLAAATSMQSSKATAANSFQDPTISFLAEL